MSNRRFPALVSALRLAALCAGLAAAAAPAAELKVRVLGRDGKPVSDVVVAALPPSGPRILSADTRSKPAIMDQLNMQFVPRILVVQTGACVAFPNSDSIQHQVYSFSKTRPINLKLYHRNDHPEPLRFDKPGVVVLGCNIHDSMIGYIYVASTPHFGKTDATGTLTLKDLPEGSYQVDVWHPRFNEADAQIEETVKVTAAAPATMEVRLTRPLRPELGSHASHDY